MSLKLPKAGRRIELFALVAVMAILASAWGWRGYEPRVRIARQPIRPMAFSPAGDVLAVGSMAGGGSFLGAPVTPILFLSVRDGTEAQPTLPTTNQYPASVLQAGYSPDGKLFGVLQAHAGEELQLTVVELATRTRVVELKVPFEGTMGPTPVGTITFRFAPDSSFIVTDGVVRRAPDYASHRTGVVWDLAGRNERFAPAKTGYSAVAPDSRLLATIDDPIPNIYDRGSLKLWNTQSGKLERAIELPGRARMWPAFSPDGRLVAVNTGDVTEVFETATGTRVFEQKGWTPRFLADGKTLLTVWRRDVQLWDTTTWQLKQTHTFYLGSYWTRLDPVIPQPQVLGGRPLIAVFNFNSDRHGSLLRWLGRTARLNAFGSHQMFLIDATTGTRQTIELHEGWMSGSPVVSADGDCAAIGFAEGVELWDFPPRRSLVAPAAAAALAVVTVVLLLARRRRKTRVPAANGA